MIKNIIFDIGNVLLSFQPQYYLNQYYDQHTTDQLMNIIFKSQEWIELDAGNILIKDAIESITKRHPTYSQEITYVLNNWCSMLTPIKDNVKLISILKDKGYKLYLLSNFHIEAIDTVRHTYDFFNLFDGDVVSGHIHVLKPDPLIYKTLLKKYNLKSDECIFIDDSLENIIEAKNQNIHGIHLPINNSLIDQLKLHDLI